MNLFLYIYILIVTPLFFANEIYSQTTNICYSPTSACFAPNTTQSLLFQINSYTTCSRVPPILRLNCVGNDMLCKQYSNQITSVKCSNQGINDKGEVIWLCEGKIPVGTSFGKTTVSCEGCTSSTDKLKIVGSCAVFYELLKTNTPFKPSYPSNPSNPSISNTKPSGGTIDGSVYNFVFGLMLLFLICCFCSICWCCYDDNLCNLRHNHCSNSRAYRNIDRDDIEAIPLNSSSFVTPSAPPIQTQTPKFIQPQVIQLAPITTIPRYPNTKTSSGTEMLGGYIAGRNISEGNYGSALLASNMAGVSGSDYNTGLMMGMMSESNNHHHKKHKKHNTPYYQPNNDSYNTSYQDTSYQDTSYTDNTYTDTSYADTNTR
jgi:hypothetical protein